MTLRQVANTAYAAATDTNFDALCQDYYMKSFESVIPELFPLIGWLKEEDRIQRVKPEGRYLVFDVQTSLGNGAGFRGEGDYLPTPHPVTNVQGKVPWMRGLKGRISMTAESMDLREGAHSFANALTQETEGLMLEMKYLGSAALWGNGDGVLAKIAVGVSNSKIVTLSSTETSAYCYPGSRWLFEGMSVIGVRSTSTYAADGTSGGTTDFAISRRIEAIDSDTSIDLASAVTTANNGLLLVEHQCANAATAAELLKGSVTIGTAASYRGPMGINAAVDDGTFKSNYCGILETTYPQWSSIISSNSGTLRALTLDVISKMHRKMKRKLGTASPDVVGWTNDDVYAEVTSLLEHHVQFKPRELKPGYNHWDVMLDGNTFNIKLDPMCPSYLYWLDPSVLVLAQKSGPTLADNHGSMWRFQQDLDSYEAVWRWQLQLFTTNRRKHAVIRDISRTIASV